MPRAKLTRAAQHRLDLVAHAEQLQRSRSMLETRYVEEAHALDLVVRVGDHPPLFTGLILGDFVENLRSSLDLPAWQLVADHDPAALDDDRIARKIQFPIYDDEEKFRASESMKHLSDKARQIIEHYQPFQNIKGGTHLVNPLSLLQALSNVDKHRILIPGLGKIEMDNLRIHSTIPLDMENATMPVESAAIVGDDTPILRIPVAQPRGTEPPADQIQAGFAETLPLEFQLGEVMLRLDQFETLLGQITELVEHVGSCFLPTDDLEERMQAWITPGFGGSWRQKTRAPGGSTATDPPPATGRRATARLPVPRGSRFELRVLKDSPPLLCPLVKPKSPSWSRIVAIWRAGRT